VSTPSAAIDILTEAAGFPETSIVVRSGCVVAEIRGPLSVRLGPEWLTFGEERASHVHLRLADLHSVRFTDPGDRNAALEIFSEDGAVLCRFSFRGTNAVRTESYDCDRAERLKARFAALRERGAGRP